MNKITIYYKRNRAITANLSDCALNSKYVCVVHGYPFTLEYVYIPELLWWKEQSPPSQALNQSAETMWPPWQVLRPESSVWWLTLGSRSSGLLYQNSALPEWPDDLTGSPEDRMKCCQRERRQDREGNGEKGMGGGAWKRRKGGRGRERPEIWEGHTVTFLQSLMKFGWELLT